MIGNGLKTGLLMAGIMGLFGAVGDVLGGGQGMLVALLFGAATNIWAYWFSDRFVLRMYGAQEVDEASAPELYRIVRDLAARAALPMPRVYLIDAAQPNAFDRPQSGACSGGGDKGSAANPDRTGNFGRARQ